MTARARRMLAAGAVALLHAGLFALLLIPMRISVPESPAAITVVELLAPIPAPLPDPPEAEKPRAPKPEAAAAPPARKAKPRPVAAPAPPEPVPAPVATAAAEGPELSAGAAAAGPGTGDAGQGFGTGAGTAGTGQGGGGQGRTRARWKSGQLDRRDLPPQIRRTGFTGSVTAHFDVDAAGRPSGCVVVRSSGNPALDQTTCRLILQRFRFHPARDSAGNPVPDVTGWRQDWRLDPPPRTP